MNQTERILCHLCSFCAVTSQDSIQDYGILPLASRIPEPKKEGLPIRREMVLGQNRCGKATGFARYSLESREEG